MMCIKKICISMTLSALESNFNVIINGKVAENEDIKSYAYSHEYYVSWMCKLCFLKGSITRKSDFKSSLIERANGHYYCRCKRDDNKYNLRLRRQNYLEIRLNE